MSKSKIKLINDKLSDFLILIVFMLSIILPLIIATSQYYITQYGDDIVMIRWAQLHSNSLISIFTDEIGGTGYRPMMHLWFLLGYNLWRSEPFYYYILNGIVFSFAMIFLYLLGKLLYNKTAGIIAFLLYIFLDGSFIMLDKLGFIAFSGEILFITSALYFSIRYYKTNDKLSMYLGIILSILAFMSKEPSLLIIPFVNLTYLYFNGMLKKNYIIINVIPFIYMLLILFVLAPDVGAEKGANLTERIISNLKFYIDTEITSQFKSSILLIISLLIAGYYLFVNRYRDIIMVCIIWFIVGILPLLITQQPVQPTYLIEANLGMVLLIGIVISSRRRNDLFLGLILIGVVVQLYYVPIQIDNIKNYNNAVSNNQKTFFETVNALDRIPQNESVFYFSMDIRNKYGMQMREDFFQDYLCIKNHCDIRVTTNYNESKYVILPSTLDVITFQKEYPNGNLNIIYNINNSNNYGFILEK